MADLGMSYDEVKLAQRIIGLKGTSFVALGNGWNLWFSRDEPVLNSLVAKGHVEREYQPGRWILTSQGIQQLKQQIGEFTFRRTQ